MSFRSANNPIDSQVIRHGEDFLFEEGSYMTENQEVENVYVEWKEVWRNTSNETKEYKRLQNI